MFIGDQARAAVSASTATARLAGLASDGALTRVSHAAWAQGAATIRITPGPGTTPETGTAAGLPALAVVRSRGPVKRGAVSVLILRWEVDGPDGLFPVLDADLTLVPDGQRAALLGLDGVYRSLPGAALDTDAVRRAATATVRCLLGSIVGAITHPPAPGTPAAPGPHRSWLT